ncbi:alpha/beta hydrolase [Stappia sp.]|uniref:alpha/beta fold hydrolase n=1 Tax=Stappia sp. TaxID=1870903 RepID=UPI0032D92139
MANLDLCAPAADPGPRHLTWQAADGLILSATAWEPLDPAPDAQPVLCLPGLSRNARDFAALAGTLRDHGHLVVCMDYRGRGRSQRDPDWRNYSIEREADDIDRGLAALGLGRVVIVGTSRGGLHAMLLAWRHPHSVAGLVLNDIGPSIERDGLRRLCKTIGRDMEAADWQTAADKLRSTLDHQYPGMSAEGWLRLARQLYVDTAPGPGVRLDYDETLCHALADFNPDAEVPDFWPVFDAVTQVPMLLLRGAHSDILSAETMTEMQRRHPGAQALTVPDEGHAPLLWDPLTQRTIAEFARRCT